MKVRLLYANTHAGQALFQGGIEHAVKKYDPAAVILNEVGRKRARESMKRLFPDDDWSIAGLAPEKKFVVESGTMIIANRDVLKKKYESNDLLTPQRWVNGRRDKWHPVRRLTRAGYVFRDKTSVSVELSSDHAWTTRGHPPGTKVYKQQKHQIEMFARDAGLALSAGHSNVRAGDYNQHMSGPVPSQAETEFKAVGLRTLMVGNLDAIFGDSSVSITKKIVIPESEIHSDHDAMVVDLEIHGRT